MLLTLTLTIVWSAITFPLFIKFICRRQGAPYQQHVVCYKKHLTDQSFRDFSAVALHGTTKEGANQKLGPQTIQLTQPIQRRDQLTTFANKARRS